MSSQSQSSFPYCFRPTDSGGSPGETTTLSHSSAVAQPQVSGNPNLATCVYRTEIGLFALTWSRNLFGRSLYLHLLLENHTSADVEGNLSYPSLSTPAFHLHLKPFVFWNRHGSRKLGLHSSASARNVHIYWDLSRARFSSGGTEPQSRFYIAVVVDGVMNLLIGDSAKEAYSKTRASKPEKPQPMVLRREHVYGNKIYATKADFNGKTREISVDCRLIGDPRLCFSVDNKRVLQIKHLKWKFRGNERIEVDGSQIQVSWDIHNWLFENDDDGYALFMFKFEKRDAEEEENIAASRMALWSSQQSCGFGFETKKMKKGLLRTARSSSSSSLSSASSNCSSVMEWASTDETELNGPSSFSLLIYAWKN